MQQLLGYITRLPVLAAMVIPQMQQLSGIDKRTARISWVLYVIGPSGSGIKNIIKEFGQCP
jgi:hypothetical protein